MTRPGINAALSRLEATLRVTSSNWMPIGRTPLPDGTVVEVRLDDALALAWREGGGDWSPLDVGPEREGYVLGLVACFTERLHETRGELRARLGAALRNRGGACE